MRVGIGAKVAVAAAAALLAVVMVGAPLYTSSATSAALQRSIAAGCPSDLGIVLDVAPAAVDGLDRRASAIDHVHPPVHTEIASVRVEEGSSSVPARIVWRDGLESPAAGSIAVPADSEVALPGSYAARAGLRAGDRVAVSGGGEATELGVAGVYPDVPVQPEPSYWCALDSLLRPDSSGAAPPVLLGTRYTVAQGAGERPPAAVWELHPDHRHLTSDAARGLLDDLRVFVATAGSLAESGTSATPLAGQTAPSLGRYIDEAEQVGDAVARAAIGPRLVAAGTVLGLLALAAAVVVRAGQTELRRRAELGEGRVALGLRAAEGQAVPALVGTAVGVVGTIAAIRAWGPSPDIDADVYRRVLVLAAAGLIGALVAVGAVAGALADRLVDRPSCGTRWWRLPWEVLPVIAAIAAWSRLDRLAGVRVVGTGVGGNDGFAAAFPVLALVAIAALLVRPLTRLLRRGRHGGGRAGAARSARRRLGATPARFAALAAVVTVGVGTVVVASSSTASVDRLVDDKARTFLGADLRVVTAGEPVIPARLAATPVSRVAADDGGEAVQVIGIDPDSFAEVVRWRDDAAEHSLDELLEVLAADDMLGAPLPAVVVGTSDTARTLSTAAGADISVEPVATAAFFPGKTAEPLVVVNRDALAADEVPTAAELWLRDPPPDAARVLAAAGNLVRGTQGPTDVFGASSVEATRWAAQASWAFAVFAGAVFLFAALAVVTAELRARRAARVFARRFAGTVPSELATVLGALLVPVVAGALVGIAAGLVLVRIVGGHLDAAANLPPAVVLRYEVLPGIAAAAVALVVAAAVAAVAQVAAGRREEVIARA